MTLFTWDQIVSTSSPLTSDSVLCIGGFDGPHLGHKSLFTGVLDYAATHGLKSGAITFTQPPKALNDPTSFHGCLSTAKQKEAYFAAAGFDFLVIMEFTPEIKNMEGLIFLEKVFKAFSIRCLFSGRDFRCGRDAAVGTEEITAYCATRDVSYQVIKDTIGSGNVKISSTLIRHCITRGQMDLVNTMLGYNYAIDMRSIPVSMDGYFSRQQCSQILPDKGSYPCKVNGKYSAILLSNKELQVLFAPPLTFIPEFVRIEFV